MATLLNQARIQCTLYTAGVTLPVVALTDPEPRSLSLLAEVAIPWRVNCVPRIMVDVPTTYYGGP